MSLRSSFARWLFKALPAEATVTQFQEGRAYVPAINTKQLILRNTSWAYAAADWNANNMATPTLRLYVRKKTSGQKTRFPTRKLSKSQISRFEKTSICQMGDLEEVLSHPLLDLVRTVNPQMNCFELRQLTGSSLEITGNGYWWKQRNALGTPIQLWFLYPQFMKVIADESNYIKEFKYGVQNNAVTIPVEDIVYFRYRDISSPVLGIGVVQKAIVSIDISNSMNNLEINLIQRGGTPETIFTFPKEQSVNPDEIERMKLDYKRKYRGTQNAGKPLILTGGAEIGKFSFSPKEMNYLGGRKWSREEIFGVFKVPISLVDMPNISRANGETANAQYQKQTILPKLLITEDTLNDQLAPDFDDNLYVAFDNPVPEDREFRLKEKQANITIGYSTVNEERAIDGIDPIEGGDELKGNVEPVIIPEKRIKAKVPPLAMPAANFIPEPFVTEVQKYLHEFGSYILAQADDEAFKSVKVANPDDLVSTWFDFTVWDKRLENTILPFVRASILIAGPKALDKVSPGSQFDRSSPGVQQALGSRTVVIRNMNRTIQKDTRKTIGEGLVAGEGGHSIRRRIEGVFGFEDRYRATRIARTETIWAYNAGAIEGYKQSGVVIAKEWSAANDERTCEWCGPLDGTIIGLEGDFFKKGDEYVGSDGGVLGFPVENIGHPPAHPQCRCSIIPVVQT